MNYTRPKTVFVILQTILIALALFSNVQAAGEVDPTFNASAYSSVFTTSVINTTAIQPDGKILVGGNFSVINGIARTGLARLNADGTLDTSFDPPDLLDTSPKYGGTIFSIALQSDGKILIGGEFLVFGAAYNHFIRLNPNGSLDASLVNNSFTGAVTDIVVLPDDKFYLRANNGLRRYNSDGTFDNASINGGGGVGGFAVQSDGKVVAAQLQVARFLTNGAIDQTFPISTANSGILKIAIQPDGKIIIGGAFTTVNGFQQRYLSRINPDGSLDVTFNTNNAGANNFVRDIIVGADGKIYIAGNFTQYNGAARFGVARLSADGTLDNSFVPPFTVTPNNLIDISLQNDGKLIVTSTNGLFRLNTDGTTDASFMRPVLGSGGIVHDVVQQPDGKIIAAGRFLIANGVARVSLARYNADGSLDTGFNTTVFSTSASVLKVALQTDGKILAGGSLTGLIRLNPDGSRDTSFTPPAPFNFNAYPIFDIDVLVDGKILVNGIYRLLPSNGSFDSFFNTPSDLTPNGAVRTAVIQPDGKILVGGNFSSVNSVTRGRIARLNADGTLDATFNPPFGANGLINEIDLQSDGKVILAGEFSGLNGASRSFIGRLNGDGTMDAGFNPVVDAPLYTVKIQPDNKILIGGRLSVVNGIPRYGYARLNSDGSNDNSFFISSGAAIYDSVFNNGVGITANVLRINLQSDGKILLGGMFSEINNISKLHIARLLNQPSTARTQYDFDGDGRADVSVFRPSNGNWYQLRSQNNSFAAVQFGQQNDQIAPADYDGDGRTDIAVFRGTVPGAGNLAYFYILNSADNSFRPVQFGATGDVPMAGDWDGDGKADLAVYRNGSLTGGQSSFYYRPSSQPGIDFRQIAWGAAGDKPLVGDFDGDGKLDAAVFRPSTATWYILRSSNNQITQTTFGLSTDVPTPADFDGDGQTNIAIFRPLTGYWYTSTNPATNYGAIQFGASGDVPVPADYDGDGRADVAVFRPSNGAWYLNRSTSGFAGVQFGAAEDKPIPNAFIR